MPKLDPNVTHHPAVVEQFELFDELSDLVRWNSRASADANRNERVACPCPADERQAREGCRWAGKGKFSYEGKFN